MNIKILTLILSVAISIFAFRNISNYQLPQIQSNLEELSQQQRLLDIKTKNYENYEQNLQKLADWRNSNQQTHIIDSLQVTEIAAKISARLEANSLTELEFRLVGRESLKVDGSNLSLLKTLFKISAIGEYSDIMSYIQEIYDNEVSCFFDEIEIENHADGLIVNMSIYVLSYENITGSIINPPQVYEKSDLRNPFE